MRFIKNYRTSHSIKLVKYIEIEGKSLDPFVMKLNGYVSMISLRHPIDRIISLYWYEHVSWFHKKKQHDQIR